MADDLCSECGGDISNADDECPLCGVPIEQARTGEANRSLGDF